MKLIRMSLLMMILSLFFGVSGCDGQPATIGRSDDGKILQGVPFVSKKPDFGGEACVEMFLRYCGLKADQDYVFDQAGVDPLLGRGCFAAELKTAMEKSGIKPGKVWVAINEEQPERQFAAELKNLESDIQSEIPWVVCLQNGGQQQFVLLLGVDATAGKVFFHDPNVREGQNQVLSLDEFRQRWALKSDNGSRFFIKFRMEKTRGLEGHEAQGFTPADYAQHIRKLKAKLPEGDFKILIQEPFVVIGDEDEQTIRRRASNTVGWAASRLKETYFTKDPNEILDIWLFKDKQSYNTNARKLFGRTPTTPFGYYSSYNKSLVMNISTGGGTLVHEIVHPFIESNFEDCPSWFNEGLASLYEQCRDNNGRIWGSTNWRLRGLQLAIQDNRVPTFEELCSTTRDEFYNEDRGTNYAQARYLCYYLQEQGKLVEYYETFRDNVEKDPTGIDSLKKVLGTSDLKRFKKQWEAYVLKLRFR